MAEVDYLDLLLKDNKLPQLDLAEIQRQAIAKTAANVANKDIVQRQPEITITADPLERDVYIQEKPSDPRELSQNRESYNMLERKQRERIGQQEALVGRQEQVRKPYVDKLNQMVEAYMQPAPKFKSQYEDIARSIAEQEGQRQAAPIEPPAREDLLTKAIYALGPGALGALTGEAGGFAAAPAQRGAYALRDAEQKQLMDEYKTRLAAQARGQAEGTKRQVALKMLMDSEQEAFNKQQETQEKRMGEAQKILSSLTTDESKRLDQAIADRLKLLQDDVESQRISIKEYQDNVGQLAQLKNQLDISKIQAESGIEREKIRGKNALEVQKIKPKPIGKGSGGKPLPSTAAEGLANAQTSLNSLNDLKDLVANNPEMFGRGIGLVGSASIATGIGDTATKAASLDSDLMATAQRIGVFLEGGKLAEGDIKRYTKMLPQRGDKPEIVKNKIASLERRIQQKLNNDITSYRQAGYDVSQFETPSISQGLTKGLTTQSQNQQQDPKVSKYAKDNNIPYEKALGILIKRGYKPQ